eukprot:1785387-Alexandrium_andersonii.AAC.1
MGPPGTGTGARGSMDPPGAGAGVRGSWHVDGIGCRSWEPAASGPQCPTTEPSEPEPEWGDSELQGAELSLLAWGG